MAYFPWVVLLFVSFSYSDSLDEMLGELFLPCDTPEAPKKTFIQNLFSGGGSATLDREELCTCSLMILVLLYIFL